MKWWVDPPEGHRFGFPKIWDDEEHVDINKWLKDNNYSDFLSFGADYIRMWEYKEERTDFTSEDWT